MNVLTGTSGFAYKEWKGGFYPSDLKNADMLTYYGSRLPSVEINNTFYRLPRPSVLEAWADCVPTPFRFVIKASRQITHFGRLKDVGDVTGYLLETARTLAERLGVILFQLPPNFPKDAARLSDFLAILPDDVRFAFEFRHPSWFADDVFEVLAERNLALCTADAEGPPAEIVPTADWGYLRLRRPGYTDGELDDWALRIGDQSWDTAYVMFKHEDDAAGPNMAEGFRARFVG